MSDVETANRDRLKLHPKLLTRLEKLEVILRMVGHPIFLTEGWRSDERQEYLYAIGRTIHPERRTVTDARAGQSKHNHGLAADYAFQTKPHWAETHPWDYFGATARLLGLEWGGDWPSADRPHVHLNLSPVAGEGT